MNIEELKTALPDYAKDIKLNLSSILSMEATPDLDQKQTVGVALASAYATHNKTIIAAFSEWASAHLSAEEINGVKAAATIMAMNNIYYRFVHSMDDHSYATMPAKLRMNIMANPGVDKLLFELCSMAVSAINGCSKCMNAHALQIEKASVTKQGIQSVIRIASVVNAFAMAEEISK